MKKEVKIIEGRKNYLLGTRKEDKKKVWLKEATWDCGWYWGLGYVEIYNHFYSDILEHTHFDLLFLESNIYTSFVEYFEETTLNEKETWELLELMKTLYTLRKYADFCKRGSAWISTNIFSDELKNEDERKKINNELIPKILKRVYEILGEKENNDQN